MSLMRVFIAIEFPKNTLDSIEKQTARLRQSLGDDVIRWVPAQNLHLTLKFIGDVAASHIEFITQMLAREAESHPSFDLQLGGVGCFPNPQRPRLLWIGIHAPANLSALQKGIETGASRLGYQQEERPFSPHLTIGRARQIISPKEQQTIRAAMDAFQLGAIGAARIDSVHLFKSDLRPGGSLYTKLFSAQLPK